ncbi:MAG: hypothetical protein A2284_05535 [Deltaproteobacteria bacterium RIFOXYA12_FULL_61_11]|nr:MAG: hypothetical protein A2284_05535 [Deltaproteobacteria bacterium RIFOXYA12_FULL_61_11]
MKTIAKVSCALSLALATLCHAGQTTSFQELSVKTEEQRFSVELQFSKALGYDARPFSSYRNYLHVEFPETRVKGGTRSFPVQDDSLVEEILLVQFSPSLMRLRLVLKQDAAALLEHSSLVIEGGVARLVVDRPPAETQAAAIDAPTTKTVEPALLPVLTPEEGDEFVLESLTQPRVEGQAQEVAHAAQSDPKPVVEPEDEFITAGEQGSFLAGKDLDGVKALFGGRVLTSLFLVVALILGLGFAYRKISARLGLPFKQAGGLGIKVVANQFIAPKKSLALVHIGTQYFLLGVAADGISLISEVGQTEAGEERNAATTALPSSPDDKTTFNEQLKRSLFQQRKTGAPTESKAGRERLMEMAKLSELIRDKVSMLGVQR